MEINSCLICSEALSNENNEGQMETDSMESSLFEDIKTSKILKENIDMLGVLCKACKMWLHDDYNRQISELKLQGDHLDDAIRSLTAQIEYINAVDLPSIHKIQSESRRLDEEEARLAIERRDVEMDLEKTEAEIVRVIKEIYENEYEIATKTDSYLEQRRKQEVINAELQYLGSTGVILRMFCIENRDKLGTINGLRLGRNDYSLVPWEEINAAWGDCVLLISALFNEKSLRSKIINLYPLGGFSRISYKKDDEKRYELYFSDYNYTNLINRYNKAQCLFLEILQEYQDLTNDKGVPYNITSGTIGGYSIMFNPSHKETWSKALRFLLQNLNYLLYKL